MRRTGSSSGFSLIEMLIAIVVIGVCGSGLFIAFSTVLGQSKVEPYDVTAGTALVREGLERVLADKRSMNAGYGFSRIVSANYPEENLTGGYTRITTISAWPGRPYDPYDPDDPDDPYNLENFRQVSVAVTKGGQTIGQATCLVVRY
jgi:prepilin-type N-terminal cleavage/methylation domain-containing protein